LVEQLPSAWLSEIESWAECEPLVLEAYVFGSRAKGCARLDNDLDVALAMVGETEGEKDANWICEADRLKRALGIRLPVSLDLWAVGVDDEKVGPAVREHGILVFRRGK
jgi:predicted nucleotidyltransferase